MKLSQGEDISNIHEYLFREGERERGRQTERKRGEKQPSRNQMVNRLNRSFLGQGSEWL